MCCESLCLVDQPIEIFPTDVGRAAISSHGATRLSCRCKSHVVEVGVSAMLVHTGCNRLPAKLHNSPFPMVVDRQKGVYQGFGLWKNQVISKTTRIFKFY